MRQSSIWSFWKIWNLAGDCAAGVDRNRLFFFSCNRFPHDSTYVELPPTQKKNEGVRFPQKKKKKNCRRNFKNLFVSQESLLPIIFHSFPPSFFCVFAVEFLLLWCCSRSDGRESTRARSEIKVILPPPLPLHSVASSLVHELRRRRKQDSEFSCCCRCCHTWAPTFFQRGGRMPQKVKYPQKWL